MVNRHRDSEGGRLVEVLPKSRQGGRQDRGSGGKEGIQGGVMGGRRHIPDSVRYGTVGILSELLYFVSI